MKNKKVNQAAKLSMRKRLFGSLNLKVLQKWFTQKVQLLNKIFISWGKKVPKILKSGRIQKVIKNIIPSEKPKPKTKRTRKSPAKKVKK